MRCRPLVPACLHTASAASTAWAQPQRVLAAGCATHRRRSQLQPGGGCRGGWSLPPQMRESVCARTGGAGAATAAVAAPVLIPSHHRRHFATDTPDARGGRGKRRAACGSGMAARGQGWGTSNKAAVDGGHEKLELYRPVRRRKQRTVEGQVHLLSLDATRRRMQALALGAHSRGATAALYVATSR